MDQKIFFKNSLGTKICGTLSSTKSKLIVMICHGLGSNKESSLFRNLRKEINSIGIATFSIDLFGHGESGGNYEDITVTEVVDDITKAKDELKKKGFKEIGFVGHSIGGFGGLIVESRDKEFKFLALISPSSKYYYREIFTSGLHLIKEWREFNKKKVFLQDTRKSGFKFAFFKDYAKYNRFELFDDVIIPVMIIHGQEDKLVPYEKSLELKKRMKNARLKIFRGIDHHYKHPLVQRKLIDIITDFISEQTTDVPEVFIERID